MTTKLLQFVNRKRDMPKKRAESIRLKDFNEIYNDFNKLEGKKATAARAEDKPKTETKVETKDTKNVTKTKTKKGDSEE